MIKRLFSTIKNYPINITDNAWSKMSEIIIKQNSKSFENKSKIIVLAGKCFWYWEGSFYRFLKDCGVEKRIIEKYPKGSYNKYQVMTNILDDLENLKKESVIENIISGFFQMTKAADDSYFAKENPSQSKEVKELLKEFKESIGSDPIEKEIKRKKSKEKQVKYFEERSKYKSREEKLLKLKNRFNEMHSCDDSPQKRGFDFEKLFFEEILSIL